MLFAAATMGWFRTRTTWLEMGVLLVATFLFFRPDWVMDRFSPKYVSAPADSIFAAAETLAKDEWLIVGIKGENLEGEPITKTVAFPVGEGIDGRKRLRTGGITLSQLGSDIEVASVKFGSQARKLGVEQGYRVTEVKLPNPDRPSVYWVLLPASLLVAGLWWLQGRRITASAVGVRAEHTTTP